MPKIPYGISDFERLRREDYMYIDKTKYIEHLEGYGEPFILFLRPRRFGKTLFLSTLESYYDVKKRDLFHSLFSGLYIEKNSTKLANKYYILKFDFSGIATDSDTHLLETFNVKVQKGITMFLNKYGLTIKCPENKDPASIMSIFMGNIANILDYPVYVLIDEYDQFANEMIGQKTDLFQETIGQTGFVRRFYQALKEATTDKVVERIFITGVSPITLDSMTSGFNIAKQKTRDSSLNEMIGFTEEEVRYLLGEVIHGYDVDSILCKLKDYYNGYLFSDKAKKRIFNSNMILYYISEYLIEDEEPEKLMDTNISSDYKKLESIFLLNDKERNFNILESILKDELQDVVFTREFNIHNRFSSDDFKSLLFYLGFLTIKDADSINIRLEVPNYAIKEIYFDFFNKIIEEQLVDELDLSIIRRIVGEIACKGDISGLVRRVEETLKKLSNRDFIHFNEKYIKIIMLTYLVLSSVYIVKSEYEVEGGYIDIALIARDNKESIYEALIELKHIKMRDYEVKRGAIVEEQFSLAKRQLLNYGGASEFKDKTHFKRWVIIFVGSEAVKIEEI